ncbi:FBD protein [Medicago truncatula]|uniref:FBD protein n=2 Tax=Medicago truncatula TaxID=3880 RepID=A0A072V8Y2_MEDTR|nr:FBD protein [Medicago truncatula]
MRQILMSGNTANAMQRALHTFVMKSDSRRRYFKLPNSGPITGTVKVVIVKAPLLENIHMVQDHTPSFHEPCSCQIEFSDCHLKEFTFDGYAISQPVILSDPSIAKNACANIKLSKWQDGTPEAGLRAFALLNQFSQAKSITFDGSEGIFRFNKELLNSAVVRDCLTSTLKVVKFGRVNGYKHELCLSKFFMENGTVLERMSFSLASQELGKSKVMEDFKENLFSFKKGFSFAVVEFSYD